MRGKILVVDDRQDGCRLFMKTLSLEGFEVRGAGSGPEVLDLVEQGWPDLIVLDLDRPGMDGIEILRQCKEQGGKARMMVLTAYGTAHLAREALALGVREFIGKPFGPDRLLQVVAEEVEERPLRPAG